MDEAFLYLIYHPDYQAIKIGVSDVSGKRIRRHIANGWRVVRYWHFFERYKAKTVESLVIDTLRKKHKVYMNKADMPYGGYTETFNAQEIKKERLIRLINKIIKGLK